MLADLKRESKGDDDFGYNQFEITSITGSVATSGGSWTFVARGSNQKYELTPNETLKKLAEGGKSLLTLAGLVTDEEGKIRLQISDAKEATN
jgi:hypothetical protein